MFTNIICCVNLTENGQDVIDYTKQIAAPDAMIYVVHALPSTAQLSGYIHSTAMEEIVKNSEVKTNQYLDGIIAKDFAGYKTQKVITKGNFAHELLKLVDKYCADIVVMGSISTKGIFNRLLENTSKTVIGDGRVPVLVVPTELSLECTPEDF